MYLLVFQEISYLLMRMQVSNKIDSNYVNLTPAYPPPQKKWIRNEQKHQISNMDMPARALLWIKYTKETLILLWILAQNVRSEWYNLICLHWENSSILYPFFHIVCAKCTKLPIRLPRRPGFVKVVAGFRVFQRDRSSALFVHQIHQLPGNITAL